jgi:D-alanine transaminase
LSVVWVDGRLRPRSEACVPVEDRGLQFGESLYEVLPLVGGEPLLVDEHVERMARGAELLGLAAGLPPAREWRRIALELEAHERLGEGLLYAQLTGGAAPRRHLPLERPAPCFLAYLVPHRFPRDAEIRRGTTAITHPDLRWGRSDIKTTMLLASILAKREALARGASEALLVGADGCLREGASSNLFVLERDRLLTPRQSEHVLPGVTRPLVMQVAAEAGIDAGEDDLSVERLRAASEVCITSTSLTVMPVLSVDGQVIGGGTAGPVSIELARRLRQGLGLV